MPALPASAPLALHTLRPSPRLPVLFIGHGSPMNAIEDNRWRRSWQALGGEFGTTWPRPQLVLCVSAHWLTRGWWLTAMAQPPTIHDFGGFPAELHAQQYLAPGAPAVVAELAGALGEPAIGLDERGWGLDHGAWSVLQPMFPQADIPVVQLSLAADQPAAAHLSMGARLRALRERGVLLVGSGNTVHNLRTLRRDLPDDQAYDWAIRFDRQVADRITTGRVDDLARFEAWGPEARLAHPSAEHFLPLLVAAGASEAGEPVRFLNEGYQGASIAMRSVVWGAAPA